jgi:hypothetical protein
MISNVLDAEYSLSKPVGTCGQDHSNEPSTCFQPTDSAILLVKPKRSKLSGKDIPIPSKDSEFKTICWECKYGKSAKSKNGWYRCRMLLKHKEPDQKDLVGDFGGSGMGDDQLFGGSYQDPGMPL